MKKFRLIYPLAALGLLMGLIACNNGSDCSTESISYARFRFYNANGDSVRLTDTITVEALTPAGKDTVINRMSQPSNLALPVSYTERVDTFVIHYTALMRDTIRITHTNTPFFISMDCGTAMYHHVDQIDVTNYAIDSIRMTNPEINLDYHENFKIYYSE